MPGTRYVAMSRRIACLGGELAGGKAGRGAENKIPFVAAISLGAEGRPLYIKMALVGYGKLKNFSNQENNEF